MTKNNFIKRVFTAFSILIITGAAGIFLLAFYKTFVIFQEISPNHNSADKKTNIELVLDKNQSSPLLEQIKKDVSDPNEEIKKAISNNKKTIESSQLNLILFGTIIGSGTKSTAIISNLNTGDPTFCHIGDSIEGATVKDIQRKKVILSYKGSDITLGINESAKNQDISAESKNKTNKPSDKMLIENYSDMEPQVIHRKKSDRIAEFEKESNEIEPTFAIEKDKFEYISQKAENFIKYATFTQYIENDKPSGVVLTNIKPKSFFDEIGLKNGDILIQVDEQPVKKIESATIIGLHLRESKSMLIKVKREGKTETIKFNIQ